MFKHMKNSLFVASNEYPNQNRDTANCISIDFDRCTGSARSSLSSSVLGKHWRVGMLAY